MTKKAAIFFLLNLALIGAGCSGMRRGGGDMGGGGGDMGGGGGNTRPRQAADEDRRRRGDEREVPAVPGESESDSQRADSRDDIFGPNSGRRLGGGEDFVPGLEAGVDAGNSESDRTNSNRPPGFNSPFNQKSDPEAVQNDIAKDLTPEEQAEQDQLRIKLEKQRESNLAEVEQLRQTPVHGPDSRTSTREPANQSSRHPVAPEKKTDASQQ